MLRSSDALLQLRDTSDQCIISQPRSGNGHSYDLHGSRNAKVFDLVDPRSCIRALRLNVTSPRNACTGKLESEGEKDGREMLSSCITDPAGTQARAPI